MKVLITGGAGYIGSVVTEEVTREGHEAVVYDNLTAGHREAIADNVPLVEGDLRDETKLRKVLQDHKIDAVIHMAALALVGESVSHPREYYNNNMTLGLALLNAMVDAGVRKIVFSSTAAVYGEPAHVPILESAPTCPQNPYGETKLAFEKCLHWYAKGYGFQFAVLRYFNAAGATERCGEIHDPETHLIPIVLNTAAGKKPYVEIYGDDWPTRDGTCVRDYIHVTDLARVHVLALSAFDKGNNIYNLGCGGEGYTVREVIETAREITGRNIAARIASRRSGDPAVLIASSTKIQKELGWNPKFQNLSTILSSAWQWLQKHPNGYSK
ncbi:UDP-glucose 4-epimerase GalE [bacterium]|nr:UDP-glucose 4-epimerase GalE [bacterium]MCI0619092.1 UDP-glucose 4-epimerase GalE [bacterium]